MKTTLTTTLGILALLALSPVALAHGQKSKDIKAHKATCRGSDSCRACTNCKYCKHCKAGGTCGVCKPKPAPEKPIKPGGGARKKDQ